MVLEDEEGGEDEEEGEDGEEEDDEELQAASHVRRMRRHDDAF